ncbi:MAG: hypothetical protein HY290_06880 [Planctomycetia bacterium]|nr:hypothetical protein [Planctomycetia bacterium]
MLPGADKCCCRCPPDVAGTVETGGPFAVARTLRIPESGLTLSDAVERSLRPGIVSQAAPISGNGIAATTLPVGARDNVQDDVRAILARNIGPAEGVEITPEIKAATTTEIGKRTDKIVEKLFGDDQSEERNSFATKLQLALKKAVDDGTFRPRMASDTSHIAEVNRQKDQLYQEILLTFVFSDTLASGVPGDDQLKRSRDRSARIFGISANDSRYDGVLRNLSDARDRGGKFALAGDARREALVGLLTPPNGESLAPPPPAEMIIPGSARSIADELAVVLTRRSGRRLIIPLQFVRTFRPGDIRLQHGDQIQIVPFPQPATGSASADQASGLVGITSWFSKEAVAYSLPDGATTSLWDLLNELENRAADAVILRRYSGPIGPDEYILPPDDAMRLSSIPVRDLDLVHLDAFGLNSLTQAGSAPSGEKCCAMCGKPKNGKGRKCCNPFAGADQQLKTLTGASVGDTVQQAGRGFQDAAAGFSSQIR